MQPARTRPSAAADPAAGDIADTLATAAAALVAVVGAVVWAGGMLASVAAGRAGTGVSAASAAVAASKLPGHLADPAAAWPAAARMPGPVLYWVAQAVALAAIAGAALGARALWARFAKPRSELGVDADAGFAGRGDLGRLHVPRPVEGRLTLGYTARRLLAAEPQASLAVVGPTGSGKTAGFAIPALLEWRGPVIATSVKNDLLEATIAHRRRQGQVWVYDPTSCSGHRPSAWSPLPACESWHGATRMAAWMAEAAQPRLDSVTDGDYWYSQARKGLAPYLHAAAISGQGLGTVIRWIDTQHRDEVESILHGAAQQASRPADGHAGEHGGELGGGRAGWDELLEASMAAFRDMLRAGGADPALLAEPFGAWSPEVAEQIRANTEREWRHRWSSPARSTLPGAGPDPEAPLTAAKALWAKEPRLRGSVFATIENVLSGWADPGVIAAAAHHDLDLDEWLAGDNTVYVVATAHEQARLRPVLTTLVQHAVRRAYDTAARHGGRLPHPCLVLLDEAGNIAPLRDLPGYASTARSHGITLVSVWQDLAQLRATYRDRAHTVLNNHRARLFGTGIADKDTLDYISGLIGDERRTEHNVSSDLGGGRRTISEYRTYRRAAPIDVIRRVRPNEAVLLYGSELPVHLRLRPWFADAALRATARRPDLTTDERSTLARLLRRT